MNNLHKHILTSVILISCTISTVAREYSPAPEDNFSLYNTSISKEINSQNDTITHKDTVTLDRTRKTIYTHLNNLSASTGLNFIYDSNLIDNESRTKTPSGQFTLEQAVRIITNNPSISVQIKDNHALLYDGNNKRESILTERKKDTERSRSEKKTNLIIKGRVYDKITKEPLIYAHITVGGKSFGTVTNAQGEFRLILHDSLKNHPVKISYIGYQSRTIHSSLLLTGLMELMMEPQIIPLQEVVVRVNDPLKLISGMLKAREDNYNTSPATLTTFYREGIEYKKNLNLTEAVLKILKTGIFRQTTREQVRVLKMRKITNPAQEDPLVAKLKSSISSALLLDISRNLPDFLTPETMKSYKYSHTDITSLDQRRVFVVSFTQKDNINQPLYKGELFIDAQNHALVEARFEIDPQYIRFAKYNLIVKESRDLNITPVSAEYIVSYKPYNKKYYVNNVRGDLMFKVKRRKKIGSSPLKIWFQMATCIVDDNATTPFDRKERLNPGKIFSETNHSYDPLFWQNFNIILPEEKIIEIIENYNFNM